MPLLGQRHRLDELHHQHLEHRQRAVELAVREHHLPIDSQHKRVQLSEATHDRVVEDSLDLDLPRYGGHSNYAAISFTLLFIKFNSYSMGLT